MHRFLKCLFKFYFKPFGFSPWLTACLSGIWEESCDIVGTYSCDIVFCVWSERCVRYTARIRRPSWQSKNDKTQLLFNSVTKLFPSFEKRVNQTQNFKTRYQCLQELCCRKEGGEFFPGQIISSYWYNWESAGQIQSVPFIIVFVLLLVCSSIPGRFSLPTSPHALLPQVSLTMRVKIHFSQGSQTAF